MISIFESIPWRSGKVVIERGITDFEGMSQDCIILNKLKFVLELNPSLMVIVPDLDRIIDGGSTNCWIVIAMHAQNLGYTSKEKGECKVISYFFGRKNPGRTLDWYFRLFEHGVEIKNISGIKNLEGKTISLTNKKVDYVKSSLILGRRISRQGVHIKHKDEDIFKILARIQIIKNSNFKQKKEKK